MEGCVRNDCRLSCDSCSLFLLMMVSRHWVRLGSFFCLWWHWLLFLDNLRLLVDCHLIHLSFWTCRALTPRSFVLFPLQILLHILTCSLLGMPEVHLKENWRKYPSWYQTSWRSMHTLDRGGRDWDGRDTNSLAADPASSTSERIERTERIECGGGKKSKMKQKYLNVTSDDLWRIRDKLSGKKSSLAMT